MFALVDCNNFYASCERVFNPALAGRPELIAETPLRVRGIKPQIDAIGWITTKVTNQLDDDGYTTVVECEAHPL